MDNKELNRSDCEILSPVNGLENLLKSLNETYTKEDFRKSIGHLRMKKTINQAESYFTNFTDSTQYFSLENIEKKKCTAMEPRLPSTDLNCTVDLIDVNKDVPLRVLIRRMLDKAFGKPIDFADVDKNRCNIESNNYEVNSSQILVKNESTNSNSEMNDHTTFHESRDDYRRRQNDKLITIEEEGSNSLHHADIVESTGFYLSGLFKFDDKLIEPVEQDNPLLLRKDTEVFPNQVDTDIRVDESLCRTIVVKDDSSIYEQNNDADVIECTGLYLSGLFKFDDNLIKPVKHNNHLLLRNENEVFPSQVDADVKVDEPLCRTIVVQDESSIHERNNDDKNESAMIINMIDSLNGVDHSSSYERTVDFLNFVEDSNNVKMKQVPNKSLNSSGKDKTRRSTDTCLKDIDRSIKKKPTFVSTFTLNLRRSVKRHRQSITLLRQALIKRTPQLSLKTNSKPAKTPGHNVTRSRNISKQKKMLPLIIFTPATPKPISIL